MTKTKDKTKDKTKKPDTLWKEIIKDLFEDFITFFIEDLAKEIDFSKGVEFLDKELSKLFSKGEAINRDADLLVKVFLKNGKEKIVLIHIEVQGYRDENFPKRMFTYYYRILDMYEKDITAIAVLTDGDKNYNPDIYEKEFDKTKITYKYRTYKILDKKEKDLIEDKNPFALVVLAGLYTIKSSKTKIDEKKLGFKVKLIRLLKENKYSKEKRRSLFIFIESIIRLSEKLGLQFEKEAEKIFEEGENMALTIEDTNLFQIKTEMARKAGKAENSIEIAKKMIKDGLGLDVIAKYVGLKVSELKKLLKK